MTIDNTPDTKPLELAKSLGLSRRQMLAAATGMAAGAALIPSAANAAPSSSGPAAAAARALKEPVVPESKRGIILYTVRDAIGRDPSTTPLPSGFQAVLQELGRIGYSQIEFAGYNQNANSPGGAVGTTLEGAALMRSWLDANGLVAQGNHGSVPSTITPETIAAFDFACDYANVIGLDHIGTGSDPTSSAQKRDWDLAIDRWDFWGRRAARAGLKLYTHNHDVAYSFLMDRGPKDEAGNFTRSSGIRRLEYFLKHTDPAFVHLEMDIFWAHVAQFKHQSYIAADGSAQVNIFNPLRTVQKQPERFPMFHVKGGDSRPDLANGYEIMPLAGNDIDYRRFLSKTGAPRDFANPMYEQDNAPSTTNLGQSLELAEQSYDYLSSLRA